MDAELTHLQSLYESSTTAQSQDETLLNMVDKVIVAVKDWMRDLQLKYRDLGCGLRPLSTRHLEEIPVFDGRSDISIYEFLDCFKVSFQGEGNSKDKANILPRKYLGMELRQMTEDKKDDFEELEVALIEQYGHPQIVVTNIMKVIPADNLPTVADNQ